MPSMLESCLLQQRGPRKKALQQQSNEDVIDQQVCSSCADRQTDNLVETHTASSEAAARLIYDAAGRSRCRTLPPCPMRHVPGTHSDAPGTSRRAAQRRSPGPKSPILDEGRRFCSVPHAGVPLAAAFHGLCAHRHRGLLGRALAQRQGVRRQRRGCAVRRFGQLHVLCMCARPRTACACVCACVQHVHVHGLHAPPNPNVSHLPPSPPPPPSSTSHLGQIGYIGFDFSIYDHLHYFKEVIGDGACFRAERDAARGAKQNGRGPAGG